jgi:YHS domain-containing protein
MKTKDIVCGMEVDDSTELRTVYKGETYHFCSGGCKTEFEKDPEHYIKRSQKHEVR